MASTTLPDAKAAIVSLLEDAEGLKGVTVSGDKEPERAKEFVWVYRGTARREFKGLGKTPPRMDETLSLRLRVFVVKGGGDTTAAEGRVYELVEAVEDALREDIKLESTVRFNRIEELTVEPILLDDKWACHALLTVEAVARI